MYRRRPAARWGRASAPVLKTPPAQSNCRGQPMFDAPIAIKTLLIAALGSAPEIKAAAAALNG